MKQLSFSFGDTLETLSLLEQAVDEMDSFWAMMVAGFRDKSAYEHLANADRLLTKAETHAIDTTNQRARYYVLWKKYPCDV